MTLCISACAIKFEGDHKRKKVSLKFVGSRREIFTPCTALPPQSDKKNFDFFAKPV